MATLVEILKMTQKKYAEAELVFDFRFSASGGS